MLLKTLTGVSPSCSNELFEQCSVDNLVVFKSYRLYNTFSRTILYLLVFKVRDSHHSSRFSFIFELIRI